MRGKEDPELHVVLEVFRFNLTTWGLQFKSREKRTLLGVFTG